MDLITLLIQNNTSNQQRGAISSFSSLALSYLCLNDLRLSSFLVNFSGASYPERIQMYINVLTDFDKRLYTSKLEQLIRHMC